MNTKAEAVCDKRRHDVQEALTAAELDAAVAKLEREGIEVIVAQHDTLGCTGCAASVNDDAAFMRAIRDCAESLTAAGGNEIVPEDAVGVVLVAIRLCHSIERFFCFRQGPSGRDDDDLFHTRACNCLLDFRVGDIERADVFCMYLVDVFADAVGTVARIDHVRNRTDQIHSVE